jgi:hypothetical protein
MEEIAGRHGSYMPIYCSRGRQTRGGPCGSGEWLTSLQGKINTLHIALEAF